MSLSCSIIVPTRGRPDALRGLLLCLAGLDTTDLAVEVIVVVDGDRLDFDPADELPGGFAVRVAEQPHAGPGTARNQGAGLAGGDLLLFTDDDCRPDRGWLQAYADAHRDRPTALLGGTTVNALPANLWSTTSELIVGMARSFYNDRASGPTFFPSNNMAAPAAQFARLGGFDGSYPFASEDRDLCDRWRHAGLPLAEAPAARVEHAHPQSFGSFARKHFAYGRGAWRYHRARKERGSGRLISDMRFQPRLPGLFRRQVPPGQRARLLWPLAVWQVANLAGFLAEAWDQRRQPVRGRLGAPSSTRAD